MKEQQSNIFKSKNILIIIIAIQIFSSSILMYLGHYQYLSILEMHTEHETTRANKIYKNVFAEVNKVYSVLSENILSDDVVDAFAKRDRDRLYALVLPKFNELKKLNNYVENLHFHTQDLHSFLRLHKPEKFGDDLSVFRPMLVKENKIRKKLFGLEVGKYGVYYRIVLPIYQDNLYIGSMELGIDIRFLMKRINQFSELTSFVILEKEKTEMIHKYDEQKAKKYLLDYDAKHELIQFYDTKKSKEFLALRENNGIYSNYKVVIRNKEVYLIHNGLILKDFANHHIGSLVLVEKVNYYFDTIAIIRWISITTTFILLLFSIVLIYVLIKRHTSRLHLREEELTQLVSMDQLTKIDNRYSFNRIFTNELKIDSRKDISMTFLMVDLDNFKHYNDNYGHPMGDEVLKKVAHSMKKTLQRPNDFLFRIGGEEFVILFSGLTYKDALNYAQSIVNNIADLDIQHNYNESYDKVTISAGLCYVDNFTNIDEEFIYKNADEALYEAKKEGRNRLVSRQYS